jgi:ferredoxin-NADP reductase
MRYRTQWTSAQILAVQDLGPDIRQIDFLPEGGPERFTAGAHLDFRVFIDDKPEIRSYSLVGRYDAEHPYRVAVKATPSSRGGSRYMWSLAPGHRLQISQPQNNFPLTFGRPEYVLLAGGIGVTPIYGMALELLARGARVQVHYGAASRAQMAYADELQALLGDRLRLYDASRSEMVDLDALIGSVTPGTQLYVCGPMPMLNAAKHVWHAHDLPEPDLRFETFGASGRFAPQAFEVYLPRLDRHVKVGEHQTLLDALMDAGVEMMYDCRKGECGLCAVDVVACEGVLDHRDLFYSEEQKAVGDRMCACVSRLVNGGASIDVGYRGDQSLYR